MIKRDGSGISLSGFESTSHQPWAQIDKGDKNLFWSASAPQNQGGLGLGAAETADLEFATRWHQEQLFSASSVLRNWDSALNSIVQ